MKTMKTAIRTMVIVGMFLLSALSITLSAPPVLACAGGDDVCEPEMEIEIDIKYGSWPNSINMGSNGKLPVVVFGSEIIDVYMLTDIQLEGVDVATKNNGDPMISYEDVNMDGHMDLIAHFEIQDLPLTQDTTELTLTAYCNGTFVWGTDEVRMVPPE